MFQAGAPGWRVTNDKGDESELAMSTVTISYTYSDDDPLVPYIDMDLEIECEAYDGVIDLVEITVEKVTLWIGDYGADVTSEHTGFERELVAYFERNMSDALREELEQRARDKWEEQDEAEKEYAAYRRAHRRFGSSEFKDWS